MYPQTFGKYVLEKELAIGGMARVLLATLRGAGGFEKKLVVKQIRDELAVDQEFVQRFVEEAKTTVALSHPNIVPVYELGIEMGTYYLAMELVDGVSVDQLLLRKESGRRVGLSPEEGAYIGVEVCRALDYAHRRMQVVHRDITPRNVMVDEEGQVKIIDFGIAARASVAGQDVFGTPGHMPPEQLRREEIGPATDIFAVAVLLMELWSGAPPFRRKTSVDSLAQMHAPHPTASQSDPRLAPLDAIISSAMALAKADRPQQADDLGRALRKFLSDTDLGDIERKLGQRVRDARAAALASAAKKKERPASRIWGRAPSPFVPR
jgi:serine/threonine-protein kinase